MEFIVEGDIEIKDSPWGPITLATRNDQGIWFVSTASHGGFWLSPERREELPEELKGTAFLNEYHGDEWWEEDCDAQRIAEWRKIKENKKFVEDHLEVIAIRTKKGFAQELKQKIVDEVT